MPMSVAFDTIDHLTITYYLKDCLPGLVLLILLSSGFSPISLHSLSPSEYRRHHPNQVPMNKLVPATSLLWAL